MMVRIPLRCNDKEGHLSRRAKMLMLQPAADVLGPCCFFFFPSSPSSFPFLACFSFDKRSCDQMMTDHVKYSVVFFSASDVFVQ